ncbi:MAG: FHA domain-containing protein [Planctomycetota bacterium]|nr:MAG: FHA domain-containing protein [Planctomycetota bacterium]
MAYLLIPDPQKGKAKKIPIKKDRFQIGKKSHNDLVLGAAGISREHCVIFKQGSRFRIKDLGSSNGTFVNGKKIQETSLKNSSTIRLGSLELLFKEEENPSAPSAATSQTSSSSPSSTGTSPAPSSTRSVSSPPSSGGVLRAPRSKSKYRPIPVEIKRKIHEKLRENQQIKLMDFSKISDEEARKTTKAVLDQIIRSMAKEIPPTINARQLYNEILDEALSLGPLVPLLEDDNITEIMVNNWNQIFVEEGGKIVLSPRQFTDNEQVIQVIRRILAPLGRRIDESSPLVDARLKDGSRVNAVIPPLAVSGPTLTIRKFPKERLTVEHLVRFGTLTPPMARFLEICVRERKNIVISGGTGSGKTTLLNIISSFIPPDNRIVTIEDVSELKLPQEHVVRLESRPPNLEGKGAIGIRQLVINALRMRPDRIVVGECRGGEALDMLQAMNTGHDGSLTTLHANSPRDALSRLETMVLMAGMDLPAKAIREQIASAVDIIIQQSRLSDGSRKVKFISEVTGMEGQTITMQDIFVFEQTGYDANGKILGRHRATGTIPKFIHELRRRGVEVDMSIFAT